MAVADTVAGGYDRRQSLNRGEGVPGVEPIQQTATSEPGDPFSKSYASPYNNYVGWAQEDNPDLYAQALANNHYPTKYSWHEAPNNHQNVVNLPQEFVAMADEGLLSTTPTPEQRGKHPYEPNNNPPDAPRVQHNPPVYTFFRAWWPSQRDEQGLNGHHLTLADNIVVQPVGGMRPNYERNKRNTYRIEPEPWDLNYTDVNASAHANATPPAIPSLPPNVGGQSYRLG